MGSCCSTKNVVVPFEPSRAVLVRVESARSRHRNRQGSAGARGARVVPQLDDDTLNNISQCSKLQEFPIAGRMESVLDCRSQEARSRNRTMSLKPVLDEGQIWVDRSFNRNIVPDKEIMGDKPATIEWKRPSEYAPRPRLYGDNVDRYSVMQGQIGDCYFMAALSSVANHPALVRQQMLQMDAAAFDGDKRGYDGVVHGRFCLVGEWIDVYTDDFLPYNVGIKRVYGGHSRDENITWVSLVEKSLAKLCGGNYNAVESGLKSLAFILLTGGITETIKTRPNKNDEDKTSEKIVTPDYLFNKVEKALAHGSIVLSSIEKDVKDLKGLVSNHAYSITNTLEIHQNNKSIKLLKIRNPWGERSETYPPQRNGVWKGRWSYNSKEWNDVPEDLRRRHNVEFDEGGEFWLCLEDFDVIYHTAVICMLTPDFDEAGFRKEDNLNKVLTILGEWNIRSPERVDHFDTMKNPRFIFSLSKEATGKSKDKTVSVVCQLMQQSSSPINPDKEHYCILTLYQVVGAVKRNNRIVLSLNELSRSNGGSDESIVRGRLKEGRYLLVPSMMEKYLKTGIRKSFSIRIFSNADILCRELPEKPIPLIGKPDEYYENEIQQFASPIHTLQLFGEWFNETAAGRDNKMDNPCYILTVPKTGDNKVRVNFHLRVQWYIQPDLSSKLDIYLVAE